MKNADIFNYILTIADSNTILAQRLTEWCGHGPILEQDIALTNIALDLLGQAQNWYDLAIELSGEQSTADDLVFLRDAWDYKNLLITEQPNGNFGNTIMRQFLFDAYHHALLTQLSSSKIEKISGVATKSLKEAHYQLRFSSKWVIRLGDGTKESHTKMVDAVQDIWAYTGEMFLPTDFEKKAHKSIGLNLKELKKTWKDSVSEVFKMATLVMPKSTFNQTGGKMGIHTEHIGPLLAEMQFLQRAYPGCEW